MRGWAILLAALVAACAQAQPAHAQDQPAPGTTGVERVAGATRVDTAVHANRRGWDEAATAVVATARAFPDALAAGPLAARRGAPLLLVEPDRLPGAVAGELGRLSARTVLVVGGVAAISDEVTASLEELPGVEEVARIGGADRFETAALVARRMGVSREVAVASGEAFPDALAAGGLPGLPGEPSDSTERRHGSGSAGPPPVLLTRPASLPGATTHLLEDLAPERAVIVGGPDAVGEPVETAVGEQVADVERIAGADRYATALAVLEEAHRRGARGPVVGATGQAFPDALAAGPLAAGIGGGLLALTPSRRLPDGLDRAIRDLAPEAALLVGGRDAVGPHVRSELAAALSGGPRPFATVVSDGGFRGVAGALPEAVVAEMRGTSWEEGCPVGLDGLALLALRHHGFDGRVRAGELVVAARVAEEVLGAFAHIHDAGFPIQRMERVDAYDGDDHASMDANNSSAFNCRPVEGGSRWSEHAMGTAIDLNPVQNPYRRGDTVLPEAGRAYLDRGDVRPGMIVRPAPVLEAFEALGWGWGGDWSGLDDWMHVSESGR